MPETLSYGGSYFNVSLPASAFSQSSDINSTTFVVERTGFSTHAMNMGMRHVELDHTFTVADDGSAVFHVSQLPPNAAILAPGPALLFCVVNGVPSNATWIMAGSGKIETQKMSLAPALPASSMPKSMWANPPDESASATASNSNGAKETSGGGSSSGGSSGSSGANSRTRSSVVAWAAGGLSLALVGLSAL
jgi:uncharacterized membrane protein YgcG